jgi:protease-4
MAFAGKVWRLLVGIKDGLSLLFLLLFFGLLYAALTARPNPAAVREGALLLELNGSIVEEKAPIDPFGALLSQSAPVEEYAVRDVVRALDRAAADDRIEAVVLDMTQFLGGGQVHLQAVGDALDRVRAADKPVLAYALGYGDDAMLLAAHASEVWVDPFGGAFVAGPGGERLYFAGLLDRLDVNARVYRVGTYKSAVEPYIDSAMSEPARENASALYSALWEEYRANIAKARPDADIDRVTSDPVGWIEAARGNPARAALQAGLVDKVGSRIDFGKRVAEITGQDDWDNTPGAFPSTDLDTWLADLPAENTGKAIGVITVAGEIVDGEAGPGTAGGTRIAQALDDALDDDLAALVVRVDSPGGSLLASEEIRRAILRHKAKGIPIAVSMANVAASGGYWVSTPADRIFAEPETITGSIGVFAVIPTFEDALANYGVQSDGVRTTPLSGQPDLFAGFTPEVDSMLQATVENSYARFLGIVSRARGKTGAQIDTIAQGRVWDGGSARQLGLVDQFGSLDNALEWAAGEAEIEGEGWHPVFLGQESDPWAQMLGGFGAGAARIFGVENRPAPAGDLFAMAARNRADTLSRLAMDLDGLLQVRGVQARCLECPAPVNGQAGTRVNSGTLEALRILLADK